MSCVRSRTRADKMPSNMVKKTAGSAASSESCAPVKMFCTEKVSAGDLIVKNYRDYKVTQVDERKNLDGDVEFYEVYMV